MPMSFMFASVPDIPSTPHVEAAVPAACFARSSVSTRTTFARKELYDVDHDAFCRRHGLEC